MDAMQGVRGVAKRSSKAAAKAVVGKVDKPVPLNFLSMYRADAMQRISIVKRGLPAADVEVLAKQMAWPKERVVSTLGLARATVDRKARANQALSQDESARVLGMVRLVGQVQEMVEASGAPDRFDAAGWVAHWLESPLPALGGKKPLEFMDTGDGQALVANLVARMQSGSYA